MKRMKCVYIFFAIAILPYFGCAGLEIKRGVTENVFYSSMSPKVKVKVDPAFTYIGKCEENVKSQGISGGFFYFKKEVYMLARAGDTNKIQGLILFEFRTLNQATTDFINTYSIGGKKSGRFSESVKIHGENYDGLVGVTNFQNEFWKLERKSIQDKGYRFMDPYFVKLLNMRVSKTSMTIYYIEEFKHIEKNAPAETENPVFSFGTEMVKSEQERALFRHFLVNSEKNIQILDEDT